MDQAPSDENIHVNSIGNQSGAGLSVRECEDAGELEEEPKSVAVGFEEYS